MCAMSGGVKFYVYGVGRWREVDACGGGVAGWGAARFVVCRRGRLAAVPSARVLPALRALAAGAPSAVREGPQLSIKRPRSPTPSPPRAACRHCHCVANKRCSPVKTVPALVPRVHITDCAVQTSQGPPAVQAPPPAAPAPPPARHTLTTAALVHAPPSDTPRAARDTPRVTPGAGRKRTRSATSDESDNIIVSAAKRAAPPAPRAPPARRPARRPSPSPSPPARRDSCRSLVLDEDVVEVLRGFLVRSERDFDARRFDRSPAYKERWLYPLQPLVALERAPPPRPSLLHFASQLGLRSVSEASEPRPRYRTRRRPPARPAPAPRASSSSGDFTDRRAQRVRRSARGGSIHEISDDSAEDNRPNNADNRVLKTSRMGAASGKSKQDRTPAKRRQESSDDSDDDDRNERVNRVRKSGRTSVVNGKQDATPARRDKRALSDSQEDVQKGARRSGRASVVNGNEKRGARRERDDSSGERAERAPRAGRTGLNGKRKRDGTPTGRGQESSDDSKENVPNNRANRAQKSGKTDVVNGKRKPNATPAKQRQELSDDSARDVPNNRVRKSNVSNYRLQKSSRTGVVNGKRKREATPKSRGQESSDDSDEKLSNFRSKAVRRSARAGGPGTRDASDSSGPGRDSSSGSSGLDEEREMFRSARLEARDNSKLYGAGEDAGIARWMCRAGRARLASGNRVWAALAGRYPALAGRARSWHSLRNRYLRYILPRLQRLPLDPRDQAMLRAAYSQGEIKSRRAASRRNSLFAPPTRGAASRRPAAPPASPPAPRDDHQSSNDEGPAAGLVAPRVPRYSSLTRQFAAARTRRDTASSSGDELPGPGAPPAGIPGAGGPRAAPPAGTPGAGGPRTRRLFNPHQVL